MAKLTRRIATAAAVATIGTVALTTASANASTAAVQAPNSFQCVIHNHTPLYNFGAIVGWTNAGQGLYDVIENSGDFNWARLMGDAGGTSYQIQKWHMGWC
ncbi:hypothetical protein [Amycolatopsis sp. CA-230715]|uniref:hypothetical protein n=1 Tax=Amycolatopsis sp. CA-230715 TaxID=2745196 RepID=UPI001C029D9C|nr:hypothetical protein [Amycolatopsis sp. CA-230715]QWF82215.1 hypothetical protein HUW46_05652 [Amycolatopsis sp. CA-230715]